MGPSWRSRAGVAVPGSAVIRAEALALRGSARAAPLSPLWQTVMRTLGISLGEGWHLQAGVNVDPKSLLSRNAS
jgi:hypothetical protein